MPEVPLESALGEWQGLLGSDRVISGGDPLKCYSANTIGVKRQISAVLLIQSEVEVVAALAVARRFGVRVYPISTGNNWGYGSACPVAEDSVILDLSGMDRVLQFNAESGVVTLEPGVTQGSLRGYLNQRQAPFMVPVTGAGPTCSIVGNAIERGYGITPHSDHFAAVTSIRAVLPDGTIYQSPLAELGATEVDSVFKWGIGPYLDGLFSQGNFGVVTSMSILLARRPESVEAFFFSGAQETDLEQLVVAVRDLNRDLGANLGSVNLMNNRRMLSMIEDYPHNRVGAGEVLGEVDLAEMAANNNIPPWTGAGALYGHPDVIRAVKAQIRRRLKPVVKNLIFINDRRVSWLQRLASILPGPLGARATKLTTTAANTLQILQGTPNEIALPLAYWRSRGSSARDEPGPANPARDGCGLRWYAPLIPADPARVRELVDLVVKICTKYGIEPLITLTGLSEQCIDCTVPILYDAGEPREEAAARECHAELVEAGIAAGFPPYRLNIDGMALITRDMPGFSRFAARLKQAVDPEGILSPGRYVSAECPEPIGD